MPVFDATRDLTGRWCFSEGGGKISRDQSPLGNDLILFGNTAWISEDGFPGAIALDGKFAHLATEAPVVATVSSYSVAVWVRLDSGTLRAGLSMEADEYAWTAVSQDSPTHSPFYLGVRKFPVDGEQENTRHAIHWNITMAPIDGSVTGTLEWRHATSDEVTDDMLDKWVLLVGVCDVPRRLLSLFVPGMVEGFSQAPVEWPFWQAPSSLQVGRARWLGNAVDPWPGSIGPLRCYSRPLTAQDAACLFQLEKPERAWRT